MIVDFYVFMRFGLAVILISSISAFPISNNTDLSKTTNNLSSSSSDQISRKQAASTTSARYTTRRTTTRYRTTSSGDGGGGGSGHPIHLNLGETATAIVLSIVFLIMIVYLCCHFCKQNEQRPETLPLVTRSRSRSRRKNIEKRFLTLIAMPKVLCSDYIFNKL